MKKESVLERLGGTTATAEFLGLAKSTVSQWGEIIPWKYALLLQHLTNGDLRYDPALYQQPTDAA